MGNSCYYVGKIKIRKVEQNMCTAEKRRNVHFKWERVPQVHVYAFTSLPLYEQFMESL